LKEGLRFIDKAFELQVDLPCKNDVNTQIQKGFLLLLKEGDKCRLVLQGTIKICPRARSEVHYGHPNQT